MNLFELKNIDGQNFIEFIIRFLFDFLVIFILAKFIYFKFRRKSNILFVLFLLNILVFFVCYLLQSVQLSIGFAFGIFAIFSILRYRTTTVPIKEMTYIFISITEWLRIFVRLFHFKRIYFLKHIPKNDSENIKSPGKQASFLLKKQDKY